MSRKFGPIWQEGIGVLGLTRSRNSVDGTVLGRTRSFLGRTKSTQFRPIRFWLNKINSIFRTKITALFLSYRLLLPFNLPFKYLALLLICFPTVSAVELVYDSFLPNHVPCSGARAAAREGAAIAFYPRKLPLVVQNQGFSTPLPYCYR